MARAFTGGSSHYLARNSFYASYPITIAAWVRPASAANVYRGITIAATSGIGYVQLALRGDLAGDPVETYVDDGIAPSVLASTSTGYTANTWHHIACTHNSATEHAVYIDGGSKGTSATNKAFPAVSSFSVARGWFNGSQFFDAASSDWAEICVWSASLADDEIAGLARGMAPLRVRPSSIEAYYPLGGPNGRNDLDRWKHARDLTAFNSPSFADHYRVIYPQPVVWPQRVAAAGGATPWLYARRRSQIIGAGGVH